MSRSERVVQQKTDLVDSPRSILCVKSLESHTEQPGDKNLALISPCHCEGSQKFIHVACLRKWQRTVQLGGSNHPDERDTEDRHCVCNVCKGTFDVPPQDRAEMMSDLAGVTPGRVAPAMLLVSKRCSESSASGIDNLAIRAFIEAKAAHFRRAVYMLTEISPGASDGSTGARLGARDMSFAQGLARNADTARARKEEEERQKRAKEIQKMRKFVATEVEKFKTKCTSASQQGEYTWNNYSDAELPCGGNYQEYESEFKRHMDSLGFTSFSVSGVLRYIHLKASWDKVARDASAEPPKKRLKGHVRTCAVCEENKPMIVLAPCGHVICHDCKDKQKQNGDKCPFCRQSVVCVTDGLFFN
ncbi:ERAD-associated E3 ubiquitin-protein ligase DOA10 [Durusdinium trenchii]|uniref:ERAD-associated E3 ubiquitin-protein ligase DOA10 n=1 Tax=Durusdinium trenchii TaxID=1381693 RepID=A0ABP0L5G9_9DINO